MSRSLRDWLNKPKPWGSAIKDTEGVIITHERIIKNRLFAISLMVADGDMHSDWWRSRVARLLLIMRHKVHQHARTIQ